MQSNANIPVRQIETNPQVQAATPIPQTSNTQQIPESVKVPWSRLSMYVASLIFGIGGSFLIVWQNLKRINKPEKARKFFIWGGIVTVITTFLIIKFHIEYGYILGYLLVMWFDRSHLATWMKENPNIKPRFGWAMVGWGLLGTIAMVVLLVLVLLGL